MSASRPVPVSRLRQAASPSPSPAACAVPSSPGLAPAVPSEALVVEIHHRVKNELQILSSLVGLAGREVTEPRAAEVLRETQARIRCLGLVHESLAASGRADAVDAADYLRRIVENLFDAYGGKTRGLRLRTELQPLARSLTSAVPLGLIATELLTNAIRHGFPDGRPGTIAVRLERSPAGGLVLTVQDDGVGLPPGFSPAVSGLLGLRIVSLLAAQIGARIELASEGGARVRVLVDPPPEPSRFA